MSLRMASPTKHPTSGTYRVRLAIPAHLREITARLYGRRAELIENLKTKDARRARSLADAATGRLRAQLEAAERALQGQAPELTERDVQALAGVFYQREVEIHGDDPGDAEGWRLTMGFLGDQAEPDPADPDPDGERYVTLGRSDLEPARELLAERGLPADPATVKRLGHAIYQARWDIARTMLRRAEGNWRPDKTAERFPTALPVPAVATPAAAPGATFDALLQGFAADKGWGRLDAKPIPRPLYDRKRTLARLGDFLGHTDAAKVSKADAVRWKEDMQARDLHASTVRNDLSECSAVWRWAIRNGKLPAAVGNPFDSISPPKAAKKARDPRAFTDAEAAKILTAARGQIGALRWLPWICCLTGARLNEVMQSNRGDVMTLEGMAVLRIHDDGAGRSVKNADSRRTVPLHPALIQEGFLSYVASLPVASPLFPDVKPDSVFGLRSTEAGRQVSRWLKNDLDLTDPRISPNHSWRHWFTDAARRVSMPLEVRSAITGHSAKMDESAGYGAGVSSMLDVLAAHLSKVKLPAAVPPLPG